MDAVADRSISSQQYRAMRIQSVRKALKLSRHQFHKTFAIPIGTLQHWENPEDPCGLSEKGAHKLSEALAAWHIRVSPEWLLHGIGRKPSLPAKFQTLPSMSIASRDLSSSIEKELAFFYSLHRDAMDITLDDDSMRPYLMTGDHVAGIKHYDADIAHCIGKDCICVTQSNNLIVRLLCESDIPGLYTLKARNVETRTAKPILYDIKLTSVAPVIWIRR